MVFARLALLTILMSTSVISAYAEENHPKKFKISVNGGFDYSQSKLTSSSSLITDEAGEVQSDLTIDKEELKGLNDANTYKLEQQFLELRGEFFFLKNASVWVGIGAETTSMRNSYNAKDEIHTKSASENPVFMLKGGLTYQYDFKDGWFVKVAPQVAWNQSNNNMMTFAQNDESAVYHTYDLKRNILRWEVPVVAGHVFGKWTPYVGLTYRDYLITDKFCSTVSYVGKDFPIEINDKYQMRTKIAGVAGCSYAIYEYLGVNLNLTFSRDVAGTLSLYFTI